MALVTKASDASMDTTSIQRCPQIPSLTAGEALDVLAPCCLKSDGLVYMSNGTAADAAAKIDGITPRAYASGDTNVTLHGKGARFRYAASGLTPGAVYFMGATAGRFDTAATTGDAVGIAKAVSATDLRLIRDY
jgi:hypothetical protein